MEEDIPIDPALLGKALSDITEDDVWNNFLDSLDSASPLSIFHVNGAEYVRLLSSINVVQNQHLEKHSHSRLAEHAGNSRDPPTFWIYRCKNHAQGCGFSSVRLDSIKGHEILCAPKPVKTTPFQCLQCPKSYSTTSLLRKHVKRIHEAWVRRTCSSKTCDQPTTLFATRKEYHSHLNKFNDARATSFTPARCTYPGCTHETEFKSIFYFSPSSRVRNAKTFASRCRMVPLCLTIERVNALLL